MKANNIIAAMRDRHLNRRQLGELMVGAGVGLVVMPVTHGPAHAEANITYFGWAGYEDPNFYGAYLQAHDEPPEFAFWADMEEGFQKLRQGFTPDVVHPCSDVIGKWRSAELIAPLDDSRLTYLPDLFESVVDIHGTVVDGERYFMPMEWGNSTIIYRTDLLEPEDQGDNLSYNLLFDPRYTGRISMWDEGVAVVQAAALALGYDNIFSLDETQLLEVRKLIERQRDIVRFYWSDNTEVEQALAAGEITLGWGWNDTYARLRAEGVPVAFGVPKEGIRTWVCGLAMHPECDDPEAAYDLINAMTSPEAGAYIITEWGFGHSNRKAFEAVEPETLAELGLSSPETSLNEGVMYEPMDPVKEQEYYRLFEAAKAGA